MVGSKASSVGNSNGRKGPKCRCNQHMKMWVSNTDENPKRKFWRCRNYLENEDYCDLFLWDDELDEPRVVQKLASKNSDFGSSNMVNLPSKNVEFGCKNCANISEYLRVFGKEIVKEVGKEFGKELGKEYGKERDSTKHLKGKKKLQYDRSKNFGLIVTLLLSWIFFLVVLKFM